MQILSITILVFFVSNTCYSQLDTTNFETWKSYNLPSNPDTLNYYNNSNRNWLVFLDGDKVKVNLLKRNQRVNELPFIIEPRDEIERRRMFGSQSQIKVDDGYLISFWRGEFGGNLYWFATDGKERKFISRSMIVQFIKRDSSIYAIEGLAHMGSSDGGIVELKKNNGNWTITDYLRLPFAPYAAQLDVKNNLVIVTSDNLISIDRNRNVDTLIKQGFWADLYPTSIVIKDNIVYIGMRQGILKFNLLLKRPEWFMP